MGKWVSKWVLEAARLDVRDEGLCHVVDPFSMARVQIAVAVIVGRVDIEPDRAAGVIAGGEREAVAHVWRAVEVVGGRLDPRVVGVARVVDVAAVDDDSGREEVVECLTVHITVRRLLRELTLDRRRHALSVIDHPPRQGPAIRNALVLHVASLDSHHL